MASVLEYHVLTVYLQENLIEFERKSELPVMGVALSNTLTFSWMRRASRTLPIEQEDALIEILSQDFLRDKRLSEVLRYPKFKGIVPTQYKDRRKFTNRHTYLLNSPEALRSAKAEYNHRKSVGERHIDNTDIAHPNIVSPLRQPSLSVSNNNPIMAASRPTDEYDIEVLLSWDPRYNIGAVQLYQGETVTPKSEVRKQVRFCIQFPNAKDKDLYSARLSARRDGIIMQEPIMPRHVRDANIIPKLDEVANRVKRQKQNESLFRDVAVKVQEVNSMALPVKKTFFRFPDGITCNNGAFNHDGNGSPPSDSWTLVKWPFMVPDDCLSVGFPKKTASRNEQTGQKVKVPYDNFVFVPGFFWDMAMDSEKIDRVAPEEILDPNDLADRLEDALDIFG